MDESISGKTAGEVTKESLRSTTRRGFNVGAASAVGGLAIYLFSLWNHSLPLQWAVLVYLITFGNVFFYLRWQRVASTSAVAACIIAMLSTVIILRVGTQRVLLPDLFLEATSWKMLDRALWTNTRGQLLLTQVGAASFPTPVVLSSEGREVNTKEDLGQIFRRSLGREPAIAYRIGTCDLAFRLTSVAILAPEEARRLP